MQAQLQDAVLTDHYGLQNLFAEICAHEYDHAAYFRSKAGPQAFPFQQASAPMNVRTPTPTRASRRL
jgi:hypothetical protein